jgi:hypothetical protein
MIKERSIPMVSIRMHKELAYALTDTSTPPITRDVHEHGKEEIRAIRVLSGLERHVLNARRHEVRYAFAPQDVGVGSPGPMAPEPHPAAPPRARQRSSPNDAAPDTDRLAALCEDGEGDAEEEAPLEPSLESLAAGHDDEDDVFSLDDPHDD